MARTISQCKDMIRVAMDTGSILSIGHQRHYSMLYAHARDIVDADILGDIKHIRALWHRNNSWFWKEDKEGLPLASIPEAKPYYRDSWCQPIYQIDFEELKDKVKEYGYQSVEE